MANNPDKFTKAMELRRKAEGRLRATKRDVAAMPIKDVQQLIHELQVHQIELEMQNEELRRTQGELTAARDRYVDLHDSSPVGYLTLDGHGKIVEANLRAETLLGVTRKGLIRQPLSWFIAAADGDIFHRYLREVLKTGTRQTCEVQLRGETGASHWVYLESFVVRGEPSPITHWRVALLDITDRKRAEAALFERDVRFQTMLDHSPGVVVVKDITGRYLYVNSQFERAFHLTRGDVVGKTDAAIFSPEQAIVSRTNDLKVFLHGGPLDFEEVSTHYDGPHTSIVSKFPLHSGEGASYVQCDIATDITQRTQGRDALLKSEERYRSIFENAVEGIFQTTLDGKYIAVNPALVRMYGYDSPEDMIATITDIASQLYVDPGRREEFIRLMEGKGEVVGFEALVYRKDGSFIWVSENVRVRCDQAGRLIGYEGTVENVTERKLAEERLRATLDQIRTLSGKITTVQEEERSRIARELHDELGVGLTCLKIDLSRLFRIVSERTGVGGPKKVKAMIQSMTKQIDTTIASVQRLVTELRPAVLDNLGLVAAIEWQCLDFQKRTGIPCTCVTSEDVVAMESDRGTALFRICQEALTNIARHAQATAVAVTFQSQRGFLQLVVTDNGVGVSDTKISDRKSLGLLGMKERVALFGGEIRIQGRPGKGTTVTAYLPQHPT